MFSLTKPASLPTKLVADRSLAARFVGIEAKSAGTRACRSLCWDGRVVHLSAYWRLLAICKGSRLAENQRPGIPAQHRQVLASRVEQMLVPKAEPTLPV